MNTKLHAVTDANGRPIGLFMTAGQISDQTGAAALLDSLPRAQWLLGDRGYDAHLFTEALQAKGITPCIAGRKSRTEPVRYDKRRYKSRNRMEIIFGRPKNWRRVATRYDRCPTFFLSAIALAATVLFWLSVLSLAAVLQTEPNSLIYWKAIQCYLAVRTLGAKGKLETSQPSQSFRSGSISAVCSKKSMI